MRARLSVVGVCLAAFVAVRLPAQAFQAGTNYIGPSISLSTYGSTAAFGGNFEHAINDKWGWGVSVGYFSYGDADFSYKFIPIGATANYHFVVQGNEKIDPFVGGGLGYWIVSTSHKGSCVEFGVDFCPDASRSSGLFPIVIGGVRYWVKDNLALVGRLGYGLGYLSVGVDFKM
ncbi:MAG: outer membrane beta-barrel protein [Gemmatimonadales bacterium]